MITDAGKNKSAVLLKDNFTHIAVGDGGDDTSSSQTTLDNEIVRKAADSKQVVGNTIVYNISFTGAELLSTVISEMGVFNAASDGDMLSRVNFKSIGPIAANETLSFTFRVVIP
tara:strand:+ start:1552 stop:1893 length:342 start_codon:yes stop_codon:yes gene_type:complete